MWPGGLVFNNYSLVLRGKGLIRPCQGKPMVNKPLSRPYFWGGTLGGEVG